MLACSLYLFTLIMSQLPPPQGIAGRQLIQNLEKFDPRNGLIAIDLVQVSFHSCRFSDVHSRLTETKPVYQVFKYII